MPQPGRDIKKYRFGVFEFDPHQLELRKHGLRVRLREQPLQVLSALLERPSEIVTREELHLRLWPADTFVDFDHSLNNAMNRLREVLDDSPTNPQFIETIPRRGYKFIASVTSNRRADRAGETSQLPIPQEAVRSKPPRLLWIASVVLASGALAATLLVRPRPHPQTSATVVTGSNWILVSDFENRSGDSALAGVLQAAFERDLNESHLVSVIPRDRVNDTLALMRKPATAVVDEALGRQICQRDGDIRALFAGSVDKLGSTYSLTVRIVESDSGRTIATFQNDAQDSAGSLAAIHNLSRRVVWPLRQELSETLRPGTSLQKVTTPSLKALQLYSEADAELRSGKQSSQSAALDLLRQSIGEDPNFASAYLLAAWASYNQRAGPHMALAKHALDLSSQVSPAERYFIEGSYYDMSGNLEQAIAAYQALLRIAPAHFWGNRNLAGLLLRLGRTTELADLSVQRAKLEPSNFQRNVDAAWNLAILSENTELARPYLLRARELLSGLQNQSEVTADAIWLQLFPAYEAWMRDDVALASAELAQAEQNPAASNGVDDRLAFGLFAAALGQSRDANSWLEKVSMPLSKQLSDQPHLSMPTSKQLNDELNFQILAFVSGDHSALRSSFQRFAWSPWPQPTTASLMLREGLYREAAADTKKYQGSQALGTLQRSRNVISGELLVQQGKMVEAIPLLSEGVKQVRDSAIVLYFLGAESLAQAYEQQQNFPAALQVLQDAAANRPRVNCGPVMAAAVFWIRDQIELERLNRRMGRTPEAEKIEGELHKLLAFADIDSPMLAELHQH